ncbi:unnamed protein product [Discula destructiva]
MGSVRGSKGSRPQRFKDAWMLESTSSGAANAMVYGQLSLAWCKWSRNSCKRGCCRLRGAAGRQNVL